MDAMSQRTWRKAGVVLLWTVMGITIAMDAAILALSFIPPKYLPERLRVWDLKGSGSQPEETPDQHSSPQK